MQTFLFTDIEESTRLWEEHPDEMAAALARHDPILTAAITEERGQVIKATGDWILARFDSAKATPDRTEGTLPIGRVATEDRMVARRI
ncbi:MAG: hypothetical protein ACRDWA_01940 [Acidimicrobiia bacterium]